MGNKIVKVIVVNNDLESLFLMVKYLEKKGIEVSDESTIGKDAYDLYKQHRPDVVIIDFSIPEYDREYAISMIKSYDPEAKIIPILNHPLEELDKSKICDVLIKPYKIQELFFKIKSCTEMCNSLVIEHHPDIEKILKEKGYEPITSSESEVLDFIHNLPMNNHPKLLFQNESFRDNILKEYFNPVYTKESTSGFFGRGNPSIKTTNSIKYKELVDGNQILENKVESFFIDTISLNHSKDLCRFACEDTVWFKEHGLFTLHQVMSKKLNPKILEKSSIFCCYDISRLNEDYIKSILDNSQIIICEKPIRVYRKKY